ncbi:hypothetical protein JXB02_01730 [Candidatus Woesearchaeota archaeon]|nr:hypothetical protein [Candidatus Woesearchaeota archaeon]
MGIIPFSGERKRHFLYSSLLFAEPEAHLAPFFRRESLACFGTGMKAETLVQEKHYQALLASFAKRPKSFDDIERLCLKERKKAIDLTKKLKGASSFRRTTIASYYYGIHTGLAFFIQLSFLLERLQQAAFPRVVRWLQEEHPDQVEQAAYLCKSEKPTFETIEKEKLAELLLEDTLQVKKARMVDHAHRFGFLSVGLAGEPAATHEQATRTAEELLRRHPNEESLRAYVEERKRGAKAKALEKKALLDSLAPDPYVRRYIYVLQKSGSLLELCASIIRIVVYLAQPLYAEAAHRLGLDMNGLLSLTAEEVESHFMDDTRPDEALLEKRRGQYHLSVADGRIAIAYGDEAEGRIADSRGEKEVRSLPGTIIFFGKATGAARVITDPSYPEKLHVGDILVCVTTGPDYRFLIEKAGAIICEGDDEYLAGYLEDRKKPALKNVDAATERLADGMSVIVDADEGKVLIDE